MTTDLPITLTDAAARLRGGQLSSVELVRALIERANALDPVLGTYVTRFDTGALQAARTADDELRAGHDRGPLHGIPVGIKDVIAVADGPTTANSLVLDPTWGKDHDAPVVSRLRQAGAIITGKTTTSEFHCGLPDPTKPFAIPRNPWDLARSPSGSSAGTGNGVAAGLFLAGLGTDTAGSLRAPASANGVTGLKPTFGRVPKSGTVPLSYSLDSLGPIARSARDCAAVLSVIAGYHPSDESCVDIPADTYLDALSAPLRGLRVGVELAHHSAEHADPALPALFDQAVHALQELGTTLVSVELPLFDEMRAGLLATMLAEGLAYHRDDLRARWGDYYATGRLTLACGTLVSGGDYVQAQRLRHLAQRRVAELFDTVDVIVSPGPPRGAARSDVPLPNVVPRILGDSFPGYWNMTGHPALSLPIGSTVDGMPLSMQIVGRPFDESLVLRVADAYQRETDWHLKQPPLLTGLPANSRRAPDS
ncbi:MAG TPA: amidase [Pseudonocardia sp.]|uniref:amidase n=1 Tax=Pseudonocardia sp. TaxID=60912 RepID=UPI002BC40E2A|nr:amidase [Pseudonocardia sp.]HTF50414.1 amidase [Pseudonocardia sp.]